MRERLRLKPIDRLLSSLDKVRERGYRTWSARCPAHADRSPSLSIREADDGTLLIHCFAGCSVSDILAAAGLESADLFPRRERRVIRKGPERIGIPPMEALRQVSFEATVVALAAMDMSEGKALSDGERARLMEAVRRVHDALDASDLIQHSQRIRDRMARRVPPPGGSFLDRQKKAPRKEGPEG